MLDIEIFDVDHGFCAAVSTGDRHTVLIDSGYSSRNGFNPAQQLLKEHCHALECLVLPAYTEEHLSGLADLLKQALGNGLPVNSLVANPSISPEQFHGLEVVKQRFGNALTTTATWHPECNKVSQTMKIHDISFSFFWNNYPVFQDAHNLSLVTFISYRDIHIIFPGDLETEGWRALLQCSEFRDRLRRINIFVASNHGQEAGYCPEVFDSCKPELIIISNECNQRISPDMLTQYQQHAKGSPEGVCDKKLLTTHDDGTITISKFLDRLRQVQTRRKTYHY